MLKKLNYIFDRKQKFELCINVVLALVAGLFELLGVSALLPLVNVILDPTAIDNNKYYSLFADTFDAHSITKFVVMFSILLIILYVLKNMYLIKRYEIQLNFMYGNRKKLSYKLMECYLQQDYLFHVNHNPLDLQRNVHNDTGNFMSVISAVISIVVEAFTCACMMVFLLVNDVFTTVLVGVLFGVSFVVMYKINKKRQVEAGEIERVSYAEMNKWIVQSFGGIKELKVLGIEKFFLDNYSRTFDVNANANKNYRLFIFRPKYITEMLAMSGLLITICIRMLMGVNVKEFAATLSVFALAAIRMLPGFNRLTEYVGNVFYGKPSVDALYEDLRQIEELNIGTISDNADVKRLELKNAIEVKNVSFKYPEGVKSVFENANLTIEKNKSVAFVGKSGAGKTTLADIILGLLEPYEGSVTVDGKDVFENDVAWHKAVGYIPQNIYLIDDTIRTNVSFSNDKDNDDKVWEALREARLEDYVKSLPEGLDTVVGDRGVKLSGGQRQRVGIARALYTKPSVLFLDEATSALDTETENAVMESINYLQGKTTLIIIAHRISTIRNCDYIYEVGEGKIELKDKSELFEENA
jgi:ABC-type multidrug transport system fused ATPase/permease subunit